MKVNKVVGQNRIGNYLILYLDPELDKGLNGAIICRKEKLKGFEYEVIRTCDAKHMVTLQSNSDENYIGETIEYE